MMSSVTLRYLVFSSLAIVLMSCAGVERSSITPVFQIVDVNGDGKIVREEFSQDMKKFAFSKFDKDGDKVITEEEWLGVDHDPEATKHFKSIDKNQDKNITFFEFADYADKASNIDKTFTTIDRNGDGNLAPNEFQARPTFKIFSIRF